MTRRHKLLSILLVLAVMTATLLAVLRHTRMDEQYGKAGIHLVRTTIYVKSRKCASGCTAGLWLSRSADRCKPPNPAIDYALNTTQLLFAREADTLVLPGDPHTLTRPTAGDWLNIRFVPPFGPAADALPLQLIFFGEHVPTRNAATQQAELGPCVRLFSAD